MARLIVAEFAKHRGRVLAERRRRRAHRPRRVRQLHGHTGDLHRAQRGVRHLDQHVARRGLRVGEHLVQAADGAVRHTGLSQHGLPRGARPRREHRRELRPQGVVVGETQGVGRESRIGAEGRQIRGGAERLPEAVVAHRQRDVAIRGRERLVGRDGRVAVAEAARCDAVREVVAGLVGEQRRRGIQHPDVDHLPAASDATRDERRQDALRREHARDDVDDGDAQAIRRAVGGTGDAHQAALGLHHRVVAGFFASGAGLAVARDRAVDDAWVARPHRRGVELKRVERAGAEVLDHHVGLRQQLLDHIERARPLEVDGHAFLVAVHAQEVRALVAEERRPPAAGVVTAAGMFQLDDAGAEVAERHGAVRTREHPGEVEHGEAVKRSHECPAAMVPRVGAAVW